MANLKEVRTRIASVSSTQQITSAMKMVSAAKFRRAQMTILGMRPYVAQMSEIISDIDVGDGVATPYHAVRKVQRVLLIVVTSNKGLCGAFNSNVIKETEKRLAELEKGHPEWGKDIYGSHISLYTIGKRATEYFSKRKGLVAKSFDEMLDAATFDATAKVSQEVMDAFVDKQYDRVEIIYNKFKNTVTQILSDEQFLPVAPKAAKAKGEKVNDYIYEPSKEDIVCELIPLTLRSQFYRIILDSLASEHGARMSAMQKATDNATELLKELKLSYNKARQAAITNEIIEIVSGSEALKN